MGWTMKSCIRSSRAPPSSSPTQSVKSVDITINAQFQMRNNRYKHHLSSKVLAWYRKQLSFSLKLKLTLQILFQVVVVVLCEHQQIHAVPPGTRASVILTTKVTCFTKYMSGGADASKMPMAICIFSSCTCSWLMTLTTMGWN
jgi:hypothetical protein